MSRRGWLRPALATAALAVGGIAAAPAQAEFERCCLRIDVLASGSVRSDGQQLSWEWRTRQVARYVEHGRIFNALTTVPGLGYGAVRRGQFTADGSGCRGEGGSARWAADPGAYTSLEDGPTGRTLLVIRSGRAGREAQRCAPAANEAALRLGGAWNYELPTPAGELLRFGRYFTLESSRRSSAGVSTVSVRFVFVAPAHVREALQALTFDRVVPLGLERSR